MVAASCGGADPRSSRRWKASGKGSHRSRPTAGRDSSRSPDLGHRPHDPPPRLAPRASKRRVQLVVVDDGSATTSWRRSRRASPMRSWGSRHKCTGLHGVSGSRATLDRRCHDRGGDGSVAGGRSPQPEASDKTLGPLMVTRPRRHRRGRRGAQGGSRSFEKRQDLRRLRRERGGRETGAHRRSHAANHPPPRWDERCPRYRIATTELFCPSWWRCRLSGRGVHPVSLFENPQ